MYSQVFRVFSQPFLFDGLKGWSFCNYIVAFDIDSIIQLIWRFVLPTYLICSPISMRRNLIDWITFTIVKKTNKMKQLKLIKWVGAGRYMSNSNKYQHILNWRCISLLGETCVYIYYIYIYNNLICLFIFKYQKI